MPYMDGMGCFNSDPYISMADFFQRFAGKRGDTTPDGSSLELKVPLRKKPKVQNEMQRM